MSPILARPRPFPAESLAGYLLRLANRNGQSFQHLLDDMEEKNSQYTTPAQFAYGRRSLVQLSAALRLDHAVLDALVYRPHNLRGPRAINVDYRGIDLPVELMTHDASPFCPQCLAEAEAADPRTAAFRAEWDSLLQPVCNRHRCQLADTCPDCGRQVTWGRKRLLYCPCHDERDADEQRGQLSRAPMVRASPIRLPACPLQQRQIALLALFTALPASPTFAWSDFSRLPIGVRSKHVAAAARAVLAGEAAIDTLVRRAAEVRWRSNGALGNEWTVLPLRAGIKSETALTDWAAKLADRHLIKRKHRTSKLSLRGLSIPEAAVLAGMSTSRMWWVVRSKPLYTYASPEGFMIKAYLLANWLGERDRERGQKRLNLRPPQLSKSERQDLSDWDYAAQVKRQRRWEAKKQRARRHALAASLAC